MLFGVKVWFYVSLQGSGKEKHDILKASLETLESNGGGESQIKSSKIKDSADRQISGFYASHKTTYLPSVAFNTSNMQTQNE